jgi:hypothetical protein
MPFSTIREIIRVAAKTEIGKGEEAVRRTLLECVILSRGRAAIVEITLNGVEMRVDSSFLHHPQDPRVEAARWMDEYLRKLIREIERSNLPSTPSSPEIGYLAIPPKN